MARVPGRRLHAPLGGAGVSPDEDLVLHLPFDESKVEDTSGRGHSGKAVGQIGWGEGKLSGALKLDGGGGHVELSPADALDKVQTESYTLLAWVRPAEVPSGTESDNNARHGILIKEGWHLGLSYNSEKQFVMEHWLAPAAGGEDPVWAGAGSWEESCDAGQWYHVAGVVDRKAGATRLYLNGELKNTAEWEANKPSRDYGKSPWRIGIARPGAPTYAWPAKGLIDDVRIYRKALGAEEIATLFRGAPK